MNPPNSARDLSIKARAAALVSSSGGADTYALDDLEGREDDMLPGRPAASVAVAASVSARPCPESSSTAFRNQS